MKKLLLIIGLLFSGATTRAQLINHYYDASNTQLKGYGYSYNVTVQLNKVSVGVDGYESYEMKLVNVTPDTKGFLYNGKNYPSSSLGNACAAPKNFGRLQVYVSYDFDLPTGVTSQYAGKISYESFVSIGEAKTRKLGRKVRNIQITSIRITRNDDACVVKIKELANPQKTAANPLNSPNGQNSPGLTVSNSVSSGSGTRNTTAAQNTGSRYNSSRPSQDNQNVVRVPSAQEQMRQLNLQGAETHLNTLNSYVSNMAAEARAEKEAKMAREDARMRAEWEASERKRRRLESRKALIADFPDGKTPLSSEIKEREIYYFVYSYKAMSLYDERPEIKISNVFPIAKYGDDTWPFKNNLVQSIAKANKDNDPITLIGYFTDNAEAEEGHQIFVSRARENGFMITPITYEGKKSSSGRSPATDFWGNPIKSKVDTVKDKNTSKPKVDYWGNPIKN